MGTHRPGRGSSRREGQPWRPTLALACLGLASTAALAALSLTDPQDAGAPLVGGGPHPTVTATAGRTLTEATSGLPGSSTVSATHVLTQLPQRHEHPDPGLAIALPLPPLLSAAPRGQVLEVTVEDPAQRSLEALGPVAPVLGMTMPITGTPVLTRSDVVSAISQAAPGARATPGVSPALPSTGVGSPIIAVVTPPAVSPNPQASMPPGEWTHMASGPTAPADPPAASPTAAPTSVPTESSPTRERMGPARVILPPPPTSPGQPAPTSGTPSAPPAPTGSTTTPRRPSPTPTGTTRSPVSSPTPTPGPSHGFSTTGPTAGSLGPAPGPVSTGSAGSDAAPDPVLP